jgi:hypothetical protein
MTAAGRQEDKNMDDDKELGPIPEHIRKAPNSTDDYFSHTRWIFPSKRPIPIQPRSEIACMLRAVDRRRGTTDSLTLINYGPVELRLRTWLSWLNWRRWRR